MVFRVTHITDYHYKEPVAEAYLELRLKPLDRENQTILEHQLEIEPSEKTAEYQDYFGNRVAFLSLPFKHSRLTIRSHLSVKTHPHELPEESLSLRVQEVRQIQTAALPFVFHYLQPTDMVKTGREAGQWAKRYFRGAATLREALENVTSAVHGGFEYRKGATEFSTDLSLVWRERIGVCQDFAHLMLSILRTAGIPSRYVCGLGVNEETLRQALILSPPGAGGHRRADRVPAVALKLLLAQRAPTMIVGDGEVVRR